MSYCRFSDGDVYMFVHVAGGIECCACSLAPKVKSIFTEGSEKHPLFGKVKVCGKCKGKGCDNCMMPGDTRCNSYQDALVHLYEHKTNGDKVPDYAFKSLRKDIKNGESLEPLLCECGEIAMLFNFDSTPPRCIKCGLKEDGDEDAD